MVWELSFKGLEGFNIATRIGIILLLDLALGQPHVTNPFIGERPIRGIPDHCNIRQTMELYLSF